METRAVSAIKTNSKYFFTYARKFSKIPSAIGPFIDQAKNIVSCPTKMAKMLANQYNSVFSVPKEEIKDPLDIFPKSTDSEDRFLTDLVLTRKDIEDAIKGVSPSAAAGPDRFPAILLKKCAHILSLPLVIIWQDSLDKGIVPPILKAANIVPIHKGDLRSVPKNYRPVALTSHLIKVFEKVLRKHIVDYMEKHLLFNPSQHGFRMGRSCLSQLLNHYDHILSLLENGNDVDVIYIDFAKAFDKVDFSVTLNKLNQLGIRGTIGR